MKEYTPKIWFCHHFVRLLVICLSIHKSSWNSSQLSRLFHKMLVLLSPSIWGANARLRGTTATCLWLKCTPIFVFHVPPSSGSISFPSSQVVPLLRKSGLRFAWRDGLSVRGQAHNQNQKKLGHWYLWSFSVLKRVTQSEYEQYHPLLCLAWELPSAVLGMAVWIHLSDVWNFHTSV